MTAMIWTVFLTFFAVSILISMRIHKLENRIKNLETVSEDTKMKYRLGWKNEVPS